MPDMTDPMNSLLSLQQALLHGSIQLQPGEKYKDIYVLADKPNNVPRYTYASLHQGDVQSVALFVLAEPVNGIPCFQLGWATSQNYRRKGLASNLISKGLEELEIGMKRNGVSEFYIEAVISTANTYSLKLAHKIFIESPTPCEDAYSGEEALQYLRLVK